MRNYLLYWSYVGSQIVQIMAELKSPQTGSHSCLVKDAFYNPENKQSRGICRNHPVGPLVCPNFL